MDYYKLPVSEKRRMAKNFLRTLLYGVGRHNSSKRWGRPGYCRVRTNLSRELFTAWFIFRKSRKREYAVSLNLWFTGETYMGCASLHEGCWTNGFWEEPDAYEAISFVKQNVWGEKS